MKRYRVIYLSVLLMLGLALTAGAVVFLITAGDDVWAAPVAFVGQTSLRVKLAPALRAATSSWGRRLLAGTSWRTRAGVLHIQEQENRLVVRCAPCTLNLPKLSAQPLRLDALTFALRREGERIDGWLAYAEGRKDARVVFSGALTDRGMQLDWQLPATELALLLRQLGSAIPEMRTASVRGRLAAKGSLQLPGMKWTAAPRLEGFEVEGLGTERLRHGGFSHLCRDSKGVPQARHTGEGSPHWLTLRQMGRTLPRAVLAAEDARFYRHPGYDLDELMPLLADPQRSSRGASTITQQLAKNFFVGADATVARKLRELLYAVEMERTLGKRRILTLYLNTVDWGPGVCGAMAASQTYFVRAPKKIAPVEAAWLAGILRNPHRAYAKEFRMQVIDDDRLQWVVAQLPASWRRAERLGTLRFGEE